MNMTRTTERDDNQRILRGCKKSCRNSTNENFMNMSRTDQVLHPMVLCVVLFIFVCLPYNSFGMTATEIANLNKDTGGISADLLSIYRKAASDDPDGYIQQSKKVGTIGLLEAVKLSLKKSLTLDIQEETVNIAKGQYQSQGGPFDVNFSLSGGYGLNSTKLDSVAQNVIPFEALDNNEATTSVVVSKQLRTGPVFSLSSQLMQADYSDELMAHFAGTADPKTTAIVKLAVKIPLLKGVGRFASAGETAAKYNYEAGNYGYVQNIFQNTLDMVEKYWDYRASYSAYDINLSMQSLIKLLLDRQQDRAGSSTSPVGDSDQKIIFSTLQAKLADASRDTSLARQNITRARQALALELGIDVTAFSTLEVPADDFKLDDISLQRDETAYLKALTKTAIEYRPDLKSLKLKVKSTEILVELAENNLKPQFDLVGSAGYMGLSEDSGVDGYMSSVTDSEKGEIWTVGFSCSYPFGNQAAKGALLTQNSSKRINVIQRNDLMRRIASELTVDIATLEHQISSLKQADISVTRYWQAMLAVMTTQIESNADLVDLLDLQEKLREAELDRISSQNNLAKAIASVRFHSGTLVGFEEDKTTIELENLTTLP